MPRSGLTADVDRRLRWLAAQVKHLQDKTAAGSTEGLEAINNLKPLIAEAKAIAQAATETNTSQAASLVQLAAKIPRVVVKRVALPSLTVGTVEIGVSWSPPLPSADYEISLTIETTAGLLGKVATGVKAGSITASGFTALISATAIISAGSGTLRAGMVHP